MTEGVGASGTSIRALWIEGLVIAAVIMMQLVAPTVSPFLLLLLIPLSIYSSDTALKALAMSILIVMTATDEGEPSALLAARWAVFMVCSVRLLWDGVSGLRSLPKWLIPLSAFFISGGTLSVLASELPEVSVTKLIVFVVGCGITLLGFRCSKKPASYWWSWLFTVYAAMVMISLPLAATSLGYYNNSDLFRGVFWHPQSFAVYMVPMTAASLVGVVLGRIPFRTGGIVLMSAIPELWLARSRTALAALLFSLVATALYLSIARRYELAQRGLFRRLGIIGVALVLLGGAGAMLFYERLSVSVGEFLLKGSTNWDELFELSQGEVYDRSRGSQINSQLDAIRRNPWAGVGFGVGAEGSAESITRDKWVGLPISAPVESGFVILAIPSQLGLLGGIPLIVFLIVVAYPIFQRGSPEAISLFIASLSINMGEMVLFSMGAIGLQVWLYIAFAHEQTEARMAAQSRMRRESRAAAGA